MMSLVSLSKFHLEFLVAWLSELVDQLGLATESRVSVEVDPALGRLGRGGVLIPN